MFSPSLPISFVTGDIEMADDTARAVGAGGTTYTIAGKECQIYPLTIRELMEIERECLKRYKRMYLQTFVDNLDLIPPEQREKIILIQTTDVAKWDIDDLPKKFSYDIRRIILSDQLREWVKSQLQIESDDDVYLKRIVVSALNQHELTEDTYEKLTGSRPARYEVGYVNWWITSDHEGLLVFAWTAMKKNEITQEEFMVYIAENPQQLVSITREIELLSSPQLGN